MDGIVNVLKPPGMTSSNVVTDVKRLFRIKRVGHTGTLDPGAAGVLPICIGRATRLFDLLVDKQKEYIAEIAFGVCTDTLDSYGRITKRDTCIILPGALQAILPNFMGTQRQIAPAYSALKHEGRPLYDIARSGEPTPERIREITIAALEYVRQTADNRFLLRICCSRGTYVRTLCEDIGKALDTYAHLSFLLRSASGPFCVQEARPIAELEDLQRQGELMRAIISVEDALSFLPSWHLKDGPWAQQLQNGLRIPMDAMHTARGFHNENFEKAEVCRIYDAREIFLGVGELENKSLRLKLHFSDKG